LTFVDEKLNPILMEKTAEGTVGEFSNILDTDSERKIEIVTRFPSTFDGVISVALDTPIFLILSKVVQFHHCGKQSREVTYLSREENSQDRD